MWGYHGVTDPADSAMEQPLCWITNAMDRSPAQTLWVTSDAWGPLKGSLLNLSYGEGKVYVVPFETVEGQAQGGVSDLPIPRFPTGVMRGRFHPGNGQLYLCGMVGWASNQSQPGGFYRLRHTGKPVCVPIGLNATTRGMSITFSTPLDRASATERSRYAVSTWSLKRSESYGSEHHGEATLGVTSATLSDDGRTVFLTIPTIAPTWCMKIEYRLRTASGEDVEGRVHNTIHRLGGGSVLDGILGTPTILSDVTIRKELKLSKEQIEKVAVIVHGFTESNNRSRETVRAKFKSLSPEARKATNAERSAELDKARAAAAAEADAKLNGVLSPGQMRRYKQLSVWARLPSSWIASDVQAALKLAPGQKAKVALILEENLKDQPTMDQLQKSGVAPKDLPKLWRTLNAQNTERTTARVVAEVLDEGQKVIWEELIGEPFATDIF